MNAKKKQERRALSRRVLEEISSGLQEIEGHFDSEGFPELAEAAPAEPPVKEKPEPEGQEEGDFTDDYYGDETESFLGSTIFDREGVEVAIDEFISHLAQKKIIRINPDETPSFHEIFEKFFGEDHEITKVALAFEDDIVGYFGSIRYDDMDAASRKVRKIRRMMEESLKA